MKHKIQFLIVLIFVAFCYCCNNAAPNKTASYAAPAVVSENVKLPKPDHIVILIEENHGYDQIIGSSLTPFMNSLIKDGALFSNSHGITHPSEPNYIALFSGSTQGMINDACLLVDSPYTTPNLGAALIDAGYSFKGFAQTMPHEGFTDCYYDKSKLNKGHLYARKHCPWVNWQDARQNGLNGDSVSFPMSAFPSDFSKLPTVAIVVPDQDHDMHNNGGNPEMIKLADDWAQSNLSNYIEWAKTHNSLFILTYDEDNGTPENIIPTIFSGQMVKPGKYNDSINHYSVLRTIEKMYGLVPSGPAKETAINSVWN